ncbi:EAL domain-containing protein [Paludibacterium paludis]|uniref:PAS domain S-box-containing protein/diguanylate cyclase (GGDEF)-like protein n=1 Tax=Paludibacterium paludis TaxID=1225769 RepID=A0A918P2X5_9NEIS|nr:EAL domain-containing protein [Paludibacterium paludis]GGY15814.1 hypothetical protein GCM10011289_18960 [Paludibacterium paludis]
MELTQSRLSRLQLFGTLAIVFALAITMAGYFLTLHWRDFVARQASIESDTGKRAREYLQAYGDHTALTLQAFRDRTAAQLHNQIREQVDQTYTVVDTIWKREHGRVSDARLRRMIVETLRPLRYFDGRGYFFIDTLDGRCVLLPTAARMEGRPLIDNKDDRGHYIMRGLIDATRNPSGSGFSHYRWYLPGTRTMADKIAYVKRFDPAGWLIGSGEYVANVEDAMQRDALAMLSSMRYGEDGNTLLIDNHGVLRLYPADPSLEGRHYLALPAPLRAQVLAMMELSRRGGFMEYAAPERHGKEVSHLAYVRRLPGWDWTLVSAMETDSIADIGRKARDELDRTLQLRISATLLMTLFALVLGVVFSWLFMRWMNALIGRYRKDLMQSNRELKERSRELLLSRFMVDHATDIVCLLDEHKHLAYENDAAKRCLGEEQDDRTARLAALFAAPPQPLPVTYEVMLSEPGDTTTYLEVTQNSIDYEGEHYLCVTGRDITQRVRSDHQLRLAARVFDSSNEAILITDADSRILAVNRLFCEITGYEESEVLGKMPSILASGRHNDSFYEDMWQRLRERGHWAGEIWNRRKDGEIFPEWLNISVLTDENGAITHFIALFTDITERKAQEAHVRHLAEYDFLTDLPNRVLIHDRLQQAIRAAQKNLHQLAVLFVDLDHFKNINDSLGHGNGDELLKMVADRLAGALRPIDTVGRTGGDEFVLILPDLDSPEEAGHAAQSLLDILHRPFVVAGHTLVVSASIGISVCPEDGEDIQTLLMNADLAMYHAKSSGRNTYQFYARRMNEQVTERLLLESHLRQALENNELELVYQPQFAIKSRRLVGCEALLRWNHPEHGRIPPDRFIPVAEDTGLIVGIGRWVLNEACRQLARWRDSGLPCIPVAVNVSARQLARHDFIEDVEHALRENGLEGSLLELEVTESTLMEDPDMAAGQLARIKEMGVRLSVDDFGTGYSSLAYLKRFAPDTIKIDRSFVCDLPDDSEDAAIVSAIIHLAEALGMDTLAEGVETEAQRQFLGSLRCQLLQGYLMGRPQSAQEMGDLLASRKTVVIDGKVTAADKA